MLSWGIFMTILRLAQAAGIVGVCLLVLLSLIPGAYRPHTGAPSNLEHLLAYGLTAAALALGWRSPSQILRIVLALLVLAYGLEMAQLLVPARSADWATAFVSGFGGFCGAVLGAGLMRGLQLKGEAGRGLAPGPIAAGPSVGPAVNAAKGGPSTGRAALEGYK